MQFFQSQNIEFYIRVLLFLQGIDVKKKNKIRILSRRVIQIKY